LAQAGQALEQSTLVSYRAVAGRTIEPTNRTNNEHFVIYKVVGTGGHSPNAPTDANATTLGGINFLCAGLLFFIDIYLSLT